MRILKDLNIFFSFFAFFFCKKTPVVFVPLGNTDSPAPILRRIRQNGSGVVESSELADLLMNLNIEPMSHVLDEAPIRSGFFSISESWLMRKVDDVSLKQRNIFRGFLSASRFFSGRQNMHDLEKHQSLLCAWGDRWSGYKWFGNFESWWIQGYYATDSWSESTDRCGSNVTVVRSLVGRFLLKSRRIHEWYIHPHDMVDFMLGKYSIHGSYGK